MEKKSFNGKERKMTVAVTGAAGTVGGYVVDMLLEKDYSVIAIDRQGALSHLKKRLSDGQGNLLVKELDLCQASSLEYCLYGLNLCDVKSADAVIHLAADLDIRKSYWDLVDINVKVSVKLFEGLKKMQGKVFIHFSSGSIYDDCGPYQLDEESPTRSKSGYECSKKESEECLKVLADDDSAPKLIILRPALIYGPRGRFLASGVMALPPVLQFVFGNFAPRICGGPKTNLVHAEDVARAAVFLLENAHKVKSGGIFNIADDTAVGFGEVFDAAAEAYGLERSFKVSLPPAALMAPFKFLIDTEMFFKIFDAPMDFVWWLIRKKYGLKSNFRARFEKEMAAYFTKDTVFVNDKIKELGFQFKYPSVRDGMKNVVGWYKENGWIPKKVKPFWKL